MEKETILFIKVNIRNMTSKPERLKAASNGNIDGGVGDGDIGGAAGRIIGRKRWFLFSIDSGSKGENFRNVPLFKLQKTESQKESG